MLTTQSINGMALWAGGFEVCHSENMFSRWQPLNLLRLNAKVMSLSRSSQRLKEDFRYFRHFRHFRDANKRYVKILTIRGDYIEDFRYFRYFRIFRDANKRYVKILAIRGDSFLARSASAKTLSLSLVATRVLSEGYILSMSKDTQFSEMLRVTIKKTVKAIKISP